MLSLTKPLGNERSHMNQQLQVEAMFPAKLCAWHLAREFLERFCAKTSLARAPSLRLNLILEELFINTVKHGHRGDSDFFIWILLSERQHEVAVTYMDQGAPFNPLAMSKAQLDVPPDERRIGGLGVYLTRELTVASDYAYLYGRNRLRLVLPV